MHLVKKSRTHDTHTATRRKDLPPRPAVWIRGIIEAIVNMAGGTAQGKAARRLRLIETLPIGPRKELLLVLCDGEKYLIATGADSVQSILRAEPAHRAAGIRVGQAELGDTP